MRRNAPALAIAFSPKAWAPTVLALGVLGGCGSIEPLADPKLTWAPSTPSPSPEGTIELQSENRPPLYLGDKRHLIDGYAGRDLENPLPAYGWRFELHRPPAQASLYVKMASIGSLTYGCATAVRVNGTTVKELFAEPDPDSVPGEDVTRSFPVPRGLLVPGENRLTIEERACLGGTRTTRRNDSLIRAVRLDLAYRPAGRGERREAGQDGGRRPFEGGFELPGQPTVPPDR